MNRAFLIIAIPAALVAAAYVAVARQMGVPLQPIRLVEALVGFLAAVVIVQLYLRRRSRRPTR